MKTRFRILLWSMLLSLVQVSNAHDTVSLANIYAGLLVYRPVGLAMTVTGATVFTAVSLLLAIAELTSSADAFADTKDSLIMTPYLFTFDRPLGMLKPGPEGVYQKP